MSFNINEVLKGMSTALIETAAEQSADIRDYADDILKKEKKSLAELAKARLKGTIDDKIFKREIAREKKVVEAELLTLKIMTKATAQKSINAAIDVFVNAIKVLV